MLKFELFFIAMCAVSVFASPSSPDNPSLTGASVREPRAYYPVPYHYNHHPYHVYGDFQHYDSIHCQPHYGHFDCHVDHYNIYGGHDGNNGQSRYDDYDGGYRSHHYHGQNPGIFCEHYLNEYHH